MATVKTQPASKIEVKQDEEALPKFRFDLFSDDDDENEDYKVFSVRADHRGVTITNGESERVITQSELDDIIYHLTFARKYAISDSPNIIRRRV